MRSILFSTALLLVAGCSTMTQPVGSEVSKYTASSLGGPTGVIVYKKGMSVGSGLTSISASDIGASGMPAPPISQRIDYHDASWSNTQPDPGKINVVRNGVREVGQGTMSITYLWDEHGTVVNGSITLSNGQINQALSAGDNYLVSAGTTVTWTTTSQTAQISFGDRSGSTASYVMGGLKIMPAGVDYDPMMILPVLGTPEQLGGTVLSGSPTLTGLIDFKADPNKAGPRAIGSIFQATPGDVDVHVPFTQHIGLVKNSVSLGLSNRSVVTLNEGDSASLVQDINIHWQVATSKVQYSFMARLNAECQHDSDCKLAQDSVTCGCMGLPNGVTLPANSCGVNIINVCHSYTPHCNVSREVCVASSP